MFKCTYITWIKQNKNFLSPQPTFENFLDPRLQCNWSMMGLCEQAQYIFHSVGDYMVPFADVS